MDIISIVDVSAVVLDPNLTTASTDLSNSEIQSMSDIRNVDTTLLEDGSVLVYKTLTNKWTSTRLLDKQNIEAGEF